MGGQKWRAKMHTSFVPLLAKFLLCFSHCLCFKFLKPTNKEPKTSLSSILMSLSSLCLSLSWPLHNIQIYTLRSLCHFFFSFSLFNLAIAATISPSKFMGNETDKLSLLALKSEISDDPLQFLSSWNESSHFCQWQGVLCSRRHQRVTTLDLSSKTLGGSISPHIGNLSFLMELHLKNNNFMNQIPQEIGCLRRLRVLRMNNNSFIGEIPSNLSSCSNLNFFDFSYNKLVGKFPTNFGFLSKLQIVVIHNNNLIGSLSPFGNISSLETLSAADNYFSGTIPESLGKLKNIQQIGLGVNSLSGTIPSSIFNCSSISTFSVPVNQIQGSLPWDLGITLPNLEFFGIGDNQFTGTIPVSLSNLSNLRFLILVKNKLSGKVPNLGKLHNLEFLSISANNLGSYEADDLSFLSTLTNATNLQVLAVNDNNFGGKLPESIGNLSTNLDTLYVGNNQLYAKIPIEIGNLVSLASLDMRVSKFTGDIPAEIGNLKNLQELNLASNELSGNIPSSLGNLSLLNILDLGMNNLEGPIPPSLGNCKNLQFLFFAQNNLNGTIPQEVISLSSISMSLDISRNRFTGFLPVEVGNLRNLGNLDVSNNMLSGEIPATLGSCRRMEFLNMGGNYFRGVIPSSLRDLRALQVLDLSRNNLSGEIPKFLEEFNSLKTLNLSFNDFVGEVPYKGIFENSSATLVMGNSKLCGGVPELKLPQCNFKGSVTKGLSLTSKLAISISCGFLGLILVITFLYLYLFKKMRKGQGPNFSSLEISLLKVSYPSLLKATDGFSSSNLLGVGSFASVYKGILDHDNDQTIVAVKVFNLLRHGGSKSFMAECEALRNIRHRNLVKVLTSCSGMDFKGNDFKALVYEFMINGNLEDWLHQDPRESLHDSMPKSLNLLQRLNIAIDVASAVEYLHNLCQTPIVHCDLKPSNVLLDNDMISHVGDFGLARFLPDSTHNFPIDQTSSTGVRGSIGYTAPEYGTGNEVSTYGDIYSFGILLLEMFTGKSPTDEMFNDGLSLHNYAKSALEGRVSEIADPLLVQESENEETITEDTQDQTQIRSQKIEECLVSVFEIGVSCSMEFPKERMKISDVVAELHSIRSSFVGVGADER